MMRYVTALGSVSFSRCQELHQGVSKNSSYSEGEIGAVCKNYRTSLILWRYYSLHINEAVNCLVLLNISNLHGPSTYNSACVIVIIHLE